MALICPLCLARLQAKDLVHFCMLHEATGDHASPNGVCTACESNYALSDGTFVAHVGCKSANPFVERFKSPPGERTGTTDESGLDGGLINPDGEALGDQGLMVSHWEL